MEVEPAFRWKLYAEAGREEAVVAAEAAETEAETAWCGCAYACDWERT